MQNIIKYLENFHFTVVPVKTYGLKRKKTFLAFSRFKKKIYGANCWK